MNNLNEPEAPATTQQNLFGELCHRALQHTGLMIGAAILSFVLFVALMAPFLAPSDPYSQDLTNRLHPPIWNSDGSWEYPLGTDQLGRDYLSRLIYGSRISLLIGFSIMVISGLIGTTLGVLAGYFGGKVDLVVNFVITTRLAMPVILVALTVSALAGSSVSNLILVLSLLLWDRFAVVTRSATIQARDLEYVTSAQAVGCSTGRIIVSEILPNIMTSIVIIATIEMANGILLAAALSFLGLGVPAPLPDWGSMIADGKQYMFFSPWVITIPGLALFALVLGINLLGDGIRDLSAQENRN
ncbi:ABC transporter permease [Pseudosulfitobacter sp. DSM 107133]|uniref:ABC transporter permease n=1 Tax=Pseudosulfitobacter sp. DSM 107133 TaxID=2883100 RepID=UPI000DF40558|nr:ABC transporter permease [Pseudosulfitobacter sp. DSM 107133]UOA29739.1 Dipeptide transport system permease protein DppC [Pseudosulfitobacter sp. DSM 107133]